MPTHYPSESPDDEDDQDGLVLRYLASAAFVAISQRFFAVSLDALTSHGRQATLDNA